MPRVFGMLVSEGQPSAACPVILTPTSAAERRGGSEDVELCRLNPKVSAFRHTDALSDHVAGGVSVSWVAQGGAPSFLFLPFSPAGGEAAKRVSRGAARV